MGQSRGLLEWFWRLLKRSQGLLVRSWVVLGPLEVVLGSSWGGLGASWGCLMEGCCRNLILDFLRDRFESDFEVQISHV